jgi:hypothetical protein
MTLIMVSLLWGLCCGYGLIKLVEAILGIVISLHGLFLRRWKGLANRAAPGMISYGIILDLLIRTLLVGILAATILRWGDVWVQQKTDFAYTDTALIIWAVTAGCAALTGLKSGWEKVRIAWKISHESGYAERRKRTFLLRH